MPRHILSPARIGLFLLLSPLCLYFFFRIFATNHYDLPVYLSEPSSCISSSSCEVSQCPYTVFSTPHRKDFYRSQSKIYLIHKLGVAKDPQAMNNLYEQAEALSRLHIHNLMEQNASYRIPEHTHQITTHILPKDSLDRLSKCVFYVPTLFYTLQKAMPESWLLVIDQKGYIRNFSDTSKKGIQDIWASIVLLQQE